VIVMPSDVYEATGRLHGVEGELVFRDVVAGMVTEGGNRLAVMDPRRRITCPECGRGVQLPPRGSNAPPTRVDED
jgi:hypothetical protein